MEKDIYNEPKDSASIEDPVGSIDNNQDVAYKFDEDQRNLHVKEYDGKKH